MTDTPITVRRATANDLKTIIDMIRLGDERSYNDEDVEQFIQRLDPEYSQAWIAIVGSWPAGMTMMFRRTLRAQKQQYTAGYWANLFVDPGYRNLMLYPLLPHAMFNELKRNGMDFLYALVRRPKVIEAHRQIGLAKIADVAVMIKPLQPARLVTKYKALPRALAIFARPIDYLFAIYLHLVQPRLTDGLSVDEIPWDSPQLGDLAKLLNDSCADRIGQAWSVEALRQRFAVSLDGEPYVLLAAWREGQLIAAIVYRTADRDRGIRMGVIMELAFQDGEERAARAVLAEAERRAYTAQADVMMYLDGLGLATRKLVAGAGYFTSSEKYALLLWPKTRLSAEPLLRHASHWRLTFADHDAF